MFDNPYVDALGPSLDFIEFTKKVYKIPQGFTLPLPSDKHKRMLIIESLTHDWFLPEPKHFSFAGDIHRVFTHGYLARPESKYLQIIRNTEDWLKNSGSRNWVPMSISRKPINTVSLFGSPGMGKSSFFDHVLPTLFGTAIKQGNRIQVPFLILNCSAFNSIKALSTNFFAELDNTLTTYFHFNNIEYKNPLLLKYSKANYTAEKLQPHIANEAAQVYLGGLVVDEINHLTDGKGELDQLVNFFKNFTRAIGVPVIFSGTPDAINKLGINLQSIRRLAGLGITTWDFYKKGDRDWNRFLTELWKFQVVDNPIPLSEEIKDTFYELTAGVMDLCVKLHIKSQTEAVTYNRNVDSAYLKIVHARFYPSTKKVTTAIKSKDPSLKGIYKDIMGTTAPIDTQSVRRDFLDVSNEVIKMNKDQASKIMDLLKFQYPELNDSKAASSSNAKEKNVQENNEPENSSNPSIAEESVIGGVKDATNDGPTQQVKTDKNPLGLFPSLEDDENGTVKEKLDQMGISGSLTDLLEKP